GADARGVAASRAGTGSRDSGVVPARQLPRPAQRRVLNLFPPPPPPRGVGGPVRLLPPCGRAGGPAFWGRLPPGAAAGPVSDRRPHADAPPGRRRAHAS